MDNSESQGILTLAKIVLKKTDKSEGIHPLRSRKCLHSKTVRAMSTHADGSEWHSDCIKVERMTCLLGLHLNILPSD